MDKQAALDVIKRGMSTEIWGLRFYEQAVARTKDEMGKQVFQSLLNDEEEHLTILRGEYASIECNSCWISRDQAVKMAEQVEPTDIFPDAKSAEQLIPEGASDEDALKMALDFERRGYDMYAEQADKATSADAKKMWGYLAKAENAHYAYLDKSLDFLASNGVWYFDENELPFFEG